MKAVQLLVNHYLPEDLRNYDQTYDTKSVNKILNAVAKKHPDQFVEVQKKISDIGRTASYRQGESITLADFAPVIDKDAIYEQMNEEIAALPKDADFKQNRRAIYQKYNNLIEKETAKAALEKRNNIAMAVLSGARGKTAQLKAMNATPGTYSDYKGEPIDVFSKESFAEGIRPATWLASTFGSRASVISTKSSTAKGGDWAKQAASVAADLVVRKDDCGSSNGLALDIDDTSLKGRVLAHEAGGIKAGTVLTHDVLQQLRKAKVAKVIARSPLTCDCANGLCARCVGRFYNGGRMPKVGDSIGLLASSTVSEPVTQMALCLSEFTEVRMGDFSVKRIKDIIPGDTVLGADMNANTFPVKVLNVFDQGVKLVRDYTFCKGQTRYRAVLTATEDHKVLLNKRVSSNYNMDTYGRAWGNDPYKLQKIRLGDMNKNTHAVYARSYNGDGTEHIEPVLAYMAGLFLGAGIRHIPGHTVCVSCADLLLAEEVNTEAAKIGMKLIKRKRGHDWAFTRNITHGRNPFAQLLSVLGMDDKYCHEKIIPACVWNWDMETLGRFIAGYFDSNGSIYQTKNRNYGINFLSTSKELIVELKALLELRFALHSTPVWSAKRLRNGSNYLRHSITINRADLVQKFATLIGCYTKGKKRVKIESLDFSHLQDRNPNGYTFGKLSAISEPRQEHCYDIEVAHSDHLFVLANGLIVSNSAKHTAGMSKDKKSFSGLEVIQQFSQSPEAFKDRAAVAELDGTVENVEEAPQGGKYVTIGGKRHYVLPKHEVLVKQGDKIEAGDQLDDGLVDPEDVVRLKGLGEGRLYYANRLNQILADSGASTDKRNTEVLARAAIRHVRITDPDGLGSYLPDDVADYNAVQKTYRVPETAKMMNAKAAVGKYLQQPALHYTVGTRITPKVAANLAENSFNEVVVDDVEPHFEPEMIRLRTASHANQDWLASMGTSYLAKQLNEAATRGDDTNIKENDDYRPRLAVGADFGTSITETGKF